MEGPVRITIHIPADASGTSLSTNQATQVLQELGVSLVPMYPGVKDPNLVSYYMANAPNVEAAHKAIERLQAIGITAFLKPMATPPA